MSLTLLNSNNKTFLKYELIDFKNNLFSIYFLENNSNQIIKTTPSNSVTINNIHNTPDDWLFQNPNTTPDSTNIEFIQLQTIKKTTKKPPSTQSSTTTQFFSKYVNTRSAIKNKTNIKKYMTNFKPILNHNNILLKKYIEKEFQNNPKKNYPTDHLTNHTSPTPNKENHNNSYQQQTQQQQNYVQPQQQQQ